MCKKIRTPDQRLRVFVSSTLQELKTEREAVRSTIKNDLKLHPIMFESGASPYPPREKYRAWLEQCQIYVGIFWESYGWIAPDMEISGIEDEYNITKTYGLPRLVYIKSTTKGREEKLEQLIERMDDVSYKSFDVVEQLIEYVKNDIMQLISDRYLDTDITPHISFNYLKHTQEDMQNAGYIERDEMLMQIEQKVRVNKKILLIGEPGCGKTFLLGSIGQKTNGIYISIRDKTPLHTYMYLTNLLRISIDHQPLKFTNQEEALFDLEATLQNSNKTLLIDDADQNVSLAKSLITLNYYRNKAIFAARSDEVLKEYPLVSISVLPFDRSEIEVYLKQSNILLPPNKLIALVRSCHGNPLYIYYYTHFKIDPMPDGLFAYHDVLWRNLNSIQRQILGLVALSLFPININLLSGTFNNLNKSHYSTMEIAQFLADLGEMVKLLNGYCEIFHPFFKEKVADELEHLGLSQSFHRVLGEMKIAEDQIVEATYHFTKAHDNRADAHLLEAAQIAYLWGFWDIAENFLMRQLEMAQKANDTRMEGFTRYRLSFLLRDKGLLQEAKVHINKAIEAFESFGDDTWVSFAKIQQSLDTIIEGKGINAVNVLKDTLDVYKGVDPIGEAMILVNLSYAYLQISRFSEGAESARKAYEIFKREGDYLGIATSLINLTACLPHFEDYDTIKDYSTEIIKLTKDLGLPRIRAAALNHLAMYFRHNDKPVDARQCLEEAIDICQRLGLINSEIINILNLGNTYKDQNDLVNAEKCYQEGLVKAKEFGSKKEEGRALELIAGIRRLKQDHPSVVEFANQAIVVLRQLDDQFQLAEVLVERAPALATLNRCQEAAQDYEEAGDLFQATSNFNNAIISYQHASSLWAKIDDKSKSQKVLEKAIHFALDYGKFETASSSIEELQSTKKVEGLETYYMHVINQYVKTPQKANLAVSMHSFATCCKLSGTKEAKDIFIKTLKILAEHANEHANLSNTLIVGLDQADERLLSADDVEKIAECLVKNLQGFYYRIMPDGTTVLTTTWHCHKPITLQIRCLSGTTTEKRLSINLLILVIANKEIFQRNIAEASGFKEESITFMTIEESDFKKIQEIPAGALNDEQPVAITQSNVPFNEEQPPVCIIIHDSYSTLTDWSVHPESKALIWLLMNFYRAIMEHFSHTQNEETYAKKSREFCEEIFGYEEKDDKIIRPPKTIDIKDAVAKFREFYTGRNDSK
jgi:tetratricopeptide (TPR) repeat protein